MMLAEMVLSAVVAAGFTAIGIGMFIMIGLVEIKLLGPKEKINDRE